MLLFPASILYLKVIFGLSFIQNLTSSPSPAFCSSGRHLRGSGEVGKVYECLSKYIA